MVGGVSPTVNPFARHRLRLRSGSLARVIPRFLGVVMLCLACAPDGNELPARNEEALRGGNADAGALPQVFMMRMRFQNAQQFVCTGTLITSRTLLAAAHCFDPEAGPPGLVALTDVYVQNASPAPSSASPTWVRIDPANTRMHPQWSAGDRLSYDIGAALLPEPSSVTPSPHHFGALSQADVGRPLTVAGFGITQSGGSDFGTRRVASLPLKGLTAKHVQLGDMSATGICNGDSGGPSFLTGRDGVLRVAGVHSYDSSLQCNDGLDTRVDIFAAAFVQEFITDFEGGPTCFEDGMCATGCAVADVDCVCVADGACNGSCPNLLTDPDCDADCVANGVCSTEDCGREDPDCTPEFEACTDDSQCRYRECVADARRPSSYCSRPCSAGCLSGTSCEGGVCVQPVAEPGAACHAATFCLAGTSCAAFQGHSATCETVCVADSDCAPASECVPAQHGVSLCLPLAEPGQSCVPGLTRCLDSTACTGLEGEAPACLATCEADTECDEGASCVEAQFEFRVCAKDPIELPFGEGWSGEAFSCSASSVTGLSWLAWLLVFRRRRAANAPDVVRVFPNGAV